MGRIRVDPAKIKITTQIKTPNSKKEVRNFLGHARYYKIFIQIFTTITTTMFKILTKDAEFQWDSQCQISL